ncbi:MAG: GYF domain-containing protein [Pseudomonadota bacterium]
MTGTPADTEWYLAREGQQFGPLSQRELDKFVELGHLRGEDLLWRAGMAEWQRADVVMPAAVEAALGGGGAAAGAAASSAATGAATQADSHSVPDTRSAQEPSVEPHVEPGAEPSFAPRPQDGDGAGRGSLSSGHGGAEPDASGGGGASDVQSGPAYGAAGFGAGQAVSPSSFSDRQPASHEPSGARAAERPVSAEAWQAASQQSSAAHALGGRGGPGSGANPYPRDPAAGPAVGGPGAAAPQDNGAPTSRFGHPAGAGAAGAGFGGPGANPGGEAGPIRGPMDGFGPTDAALGGMPGSGPGLGSGPGASPPMSPSPGGFGSSGLPDPGQIGGLAQPGSYTLDPRAAPRPKRGGGLGIAIAAAFVLLAGGGAAAYFYGDKLIDQASAMLSSSAPKQTEAARTTTPKRTTSQPPASTLDITPTNPPAQPETTARAQPVTLQPPPTPAVPKAPETPAPSEIAASTLPNTTLWNYTRTAFPAWYKESAQLASKLKDEGKPPAAINEALAKRLVALRRQNAKHALSADRAQLRIIATSFLASVRKLREHSVEACYGFISQGESSAVVIPLMNNPTYSAVLEAQMLAVLKAVSAGKAAPKSYAAPRRDHYQTLGQLLTSRGWSPNDLRLFTDPNALSRASPTRVCRMVQDWFAAQLAISDDETKTRLIVESIRPVVAG